MEILAALSQMSLPAWLVSIAAIVVILHQVGVLKWVTESLRDKQEYEQEKELKYQTYQNLQDSWREDKIATLLEENESFVRERVWDKLEKIENLLDERLYRSEMTLGQFKDTLRVIGREVYELKVALGRRKDDEDRS